MIRIKEIEIKFPKWKWWQIVLGIMTIIIASNVSPTIVLETVKELFEAWLLQ
jgi:hypothetical protein